MGQGHAALPARGELVVELPLHPAVEVHGALMPLGELGYLRVGRVLERMWPSTPVRAVSLGQCAPGGEVVQGGALALLECLERQVAAC